MTSTVENEYWLTKYLEEDDPLPMIRAIFTTALIVGTEEYRAYSKAVDEEAVSEFFERHWDKMLLIMRAMHDETVNVHARRGKVFEA